MGEHGNTTTQPVSTSVYANFKEHFSAKISNTNLSLLESIRNVHPDKHITPIAVRDAGLIDFANAGKSTANIIRSGHQFVNKYDYSPPESRLEVGDGKLREDFTFGCYDYHYQGDDFIVYVAEWQTDCSYYHMQYILTSRETVSDSQCPIAAKLIKDAGKWSSQLHEQVYVFDSGQWIKSHQLWEAVQSAAWDDVILEPTMKDTLIKDVEGFFDSRDVYKEFNVSWKRGIIFHGTPGCGKTISIKALMKTLQDRDVASLYVKSFEAKMGQQYSIRFIFQQARIMAPCLLIFEDLDSLVVDEVRSYFLNEVDGLENNDGILMIGSTNHLERLDPGISKRPSRFDRKYHYSMPATAERIQYCQYWRAKLQKNSKIDFPEDICDVAAQLTDGFSYAYMKELFIQTLLTIVGGRVDDIDEEEDVPDAVEKAKVIGGSGSLVQEGQSLDSATQEASSAPPSEEKKPERKMPEVDIPEHLRSNPLMRILQKQARSLWKEMDNTTDEIHSRSKVSSGSHN